MSAAGVIELIKKLPPAEQGVVCDYVRTTPEIATETPIAYAADQEFEAVTDRVFTDNQDLLRRLAQ
ncbi:MAG: hypothetical protein EAZ36_00175 [Verrucomicrobia bacterium]|nr:MAG: hypothetical protein EAZ36_00175 [Verrucomicrobiota bacterium]